MNIAIVLSGGIGSRLGADVPKQYLEVAGKPIIAYCLEVLQEHPLIDVIQIVAEEEWRPLILRWSGEKLRGISKPGENRQLSILSALEDIREYVSNEDIVLIHDAARPLVSGQLITRCLEKCKKCEGVMPALSMKDTVYYGINGRIESLLERECIVAGQAPEVFRYEKYYKANKQLSREEILKINGSAEPAIKACMDVQYIVGEEQNFKITTRNDLERFRQMVETME